MILLDTCVLSEVLRPKPEAVVLQWIAGLNEATVYLSALVLVELAYGVERLSAGSKRQALELWLEQLCERFAKRIIPFDQDAAHAWASLRASLEQKGRVLPLADSLIAATAISRQAILATRNQTDFADTGVVIVNPWLC